MSSLQDWQYVVEVSDDLRTWTPLETEIFGTGSDIICTNLLNDASCRFYRVRRSDTFSVSFDQKCFQIGSEWLFDVYENFDGEISNYQRLEQIERFSTKNGYFVAESGIYSNGTQWVGTEYVLQNASNGVFIVGYKSLEEGEVFYEEPEPSLVNQFTPGVPYDSQTIPAPAPDYSTLNWVATVYVDYSTVIVPAGSFPMTIRLDESVTGSYLGYSFTIEAKTWYAKEVGEIKYESTLVFDDPEIGQ